jgi:hypothetical protein
LRWGIEKDSKDGEGDRNGRRARCRDAFVLGVLTRENGPSGSGFETVPVRQPGSGDLEAATALHRTIAAALGRGDIVAAGRAAKALSALLGVISEVV